MTAKDFVKSKFPKAKAERQKTNGGEVCYLIRDGRNTMYMADGNTESKAWKSAKENIERSTNQTQPQ